MLVVLPTDHYRNIMPHPNKGRMITENATYTGDMFMPYKSRVVCYLTSWSLYRTGNDVYKIEDINSSLCTHIIYAFANLYGDGTIKVGDSYTDSSSGQNGYNRLNALKKVNTNLKTLIAIGGGSAGSTNFSKVFNSASLRAAFVDNAANFVRQNGFNGLDVDWEFPGDGTGSQTSDKSHLSGITERVDDTTVQLFQPAQATGENILFYSTYLRWSKLCRHILACVPKCVGGSI
uniref:(California timema) hypothetical protein n=1 Tax=Timema californicum TaxID=61474 RepID=A0A7R9JHS7_TIMCA|nr:unnamed protein product [Timema californicum]